MSPWREMEREAERVGRRYRGGPGTGTGTGTVTRDSSGPSLREGPGRVGCQKGSP